MNIPVLYSPALPLPNARWLPITKERLVERTLASFDIAKVGDLFPNGHVFNIAEDSRYHAATFMDQFIMNRIRSAFKPLIPTFPIEPDSFTPLNIIIESKNGEHLISKLYKACMALVPCGDDKIQESWEKDLGHPILDEQWKKCCTAIQEISLNSRHKLLHFKFLRRIYITPERQHKN